MEIKNDIHSLSSLSGLCTSLLLTLVFLPVISCTDDTNADDVDNRISFDVRVTQQVPQSAPGALPSATPVGGWKQSPSVNKDVLVLQSDQTPECLYLHPTVSDWEDKSAPAAGNNIQAFGIYAHVYNKHEKWDSSHQPGYLNNVKVKKQKEGMYFPDGIYYWPGANRNIRFTAYAPYDAESIVFDRDNVSGNMPGLHYTVPPEVTAQQDVMVAISGELPGDYNLPFSLPFQHILTGIRFVADEGGLPGEIKQIQIKGIDNEATYRLCPCGKYKPSGENGGWKDPCGKESYTATYTATSAVTSTATSIATGDAFLMIPQEIGDSGEIIISFRNGETSGELTFHAAIPEGTVWKMGRIITYHISDKPL